MEHSIAADDDDIRFDRWFKRHYPGLQHALLEKYLRKGDIRLDGKKAKSSDRVHAGQVIQVKCIFPEGKQHPSVVRPPPTADDMRMVQDMVLYRDERIIIVNKPHGLPVQGGSKISRSLDDLLDGLTFDAKERPKLTHRLDRDTSGVLVLARSSKAATALMRLFSTRKINKTYWALVNNVPDPSRGTVDLPLAKKDSPKANGYPGGPEGRDYEIMHIDEEEGQKALSEYRIIDSLARRFALVELKPLTGRTHQLRVHMQAIGCPIVGDHKYGGSMNEAKALGVENILHLHARRIVIPAFLGGNTIDISAPLPPHMRHSFQALGLDIPKK